MEKTSTPFLGRNSGNNTNFILHQGVRRSPKIKKVAPNLIGMVNPKIFEPFYAGRKISESRDRQ